MVWLSIGALVVCAAMFYMAAEHAAGVTRGDWSARLWLVIAVGSFLLAVPLLVWYGPAEGFPKYLAIAIPAVTGLACFWFVKVHVDHEQNGGGLIAAALGLTLFAISFVAFFGQLGQKLDDAPFADEPQTIEQRLAAFQRQEHELQKQLLDGIPTFRRKLEGQAFDYKSKLATATPAIKVEIEQELRTIARTLVALEKKQKEVEDMIARLEIGQHRLERLRDSQKLLGDEQGLAEELDQLWFDSETQLSSLQQNQLDAGAIGEAEVNERFKQLVGDQSP